MLRNSRLIRSARIALSISGRTLTPASSQSLSRFQHTEAGSTESTTPTTANIQSLLKKNEDPERHARFLKARADRQKKFEDSAATLVASLDAQISENTPSKELFQNFFKSVEKLPHLHQNTYRARRTFAAPLDKIIKKASTEIEDPTQTHLPVTPQEILNKAIYYEVADIVNFNTVALDLFKTGYFNDILPLWVSYLEYSVSQRITATPYYLRSITILSYLESTLGTKPEIEIIKQLLRIEELPKASELRNILSRALSPSSPRYQPLVDAINALYFSSRDPNSLDLIKNASIAASRGEVFKVYNAFNDARKIAELSGQNLNEETLVAFMNIFNNIKFQESMNIWNEIVKSGIKPSTSAWNALLDTVSRRKGSPAARVQEVETVYHKIPEPDHHTIVKLIDIYTRLKAYDKVEELATKENLSVPIISQSYLQSLAAQKNFPRLKSLTKELASRNITLSKVSYNKMLHIFTQQGRYEDARIILREMSDKGITPDVATFTIVLDLTLKAVKAGGFVPTTDLINEFFGQMRAEGIEPNSYTITTILDTLGKESTSLASAQELFEVMKQKNMATAVSYVSLISNEFALGRTQDAEAHFKEYIDAGFKVLPANWAMVFEGWNKNSNIPKAREYLALLKQTPKYSALLNRFSYYFLLQLADAKKDTEFANEIFALIKDLGTSETISNITLHSVRRLQGLGANVPSELAARL